MGTFYSIKVVKKNKNEMRIDPTYIEEGIKKRLDDINNIMSTYIKDSEISKFNQLQNTEYFSITYPLFRVVQHALKISKLSEGAFDITVGPLVNLWGFGPEDRGNLFPTEQEIEDKKKITGFKNLELSENPRALRKKNISVFCDLSAIAKGYGVDQIAEYLDSLTYDGYLVEIGGEIRTKGRSHTGEFWKIGISTPDEEYGIQKVIMLNNTAIATSGDYRNYYERDGLRYSHTINPRSGRPITHALASVTVIHPSCMSADAYATAINVLGPIDGLEFAQKQKLPAFFIVKNDTGFVEVMTPAFNRYLAKI
jgi:thiamine biosynthesis lipoprotein